MIGTTNPKYPMNPPPLPPFTAESAAEKERLAQDAWNTCDPVRARFAQDWHDEEPR
jgi:nuclear transport factor 2 (NTF2) superfamily protein